MLDITSAFCRWASRMFRWKSPLHHYLKVQYVKRNIDPKVPLKHLMNQTDKKTVFACHLCVKFAAQHIPIIELWATINNLKIFNEGFLCSKCDKRLKNTYHLRRHNSTHKEEYAIYKDCGAFFSRQLKNHGKKMLQNVKTTKWNMQN